MFQTRRSPGSVEIVVVPVGLAFVAGDNGWLHRGGVVKRAGDRKVTRLILQESNRYQSIAAQAPL